MYQVGRHDVRAKTKAYKWKAEQARAFVAKKQYQYKVYVRVIISQVSVIL
jgi:hypothetical protein